MFRFEFRGINVFKMNRTRKLIFCKNKLVDCIFQSSLSSTSVIANSVYGIRFNSQNTTCVSPLKSPVRSLQLKKRLVKKKNVSSNVGFRVAAFSTAEEYNLERLAQSISESTAFRPESFSSDHGSLVDVMHAINNEKEERESQHLFFFRNGCTVMWNVSNSEICKILDIIKHCEENSYRKEIIENESETMTYLYSTDRCKTGIVGDSVIFSKNVNIILEKYTISNAMALSVHLGTFEANLQHYIDTMEPVTEDLKMGKMIKMSRDEVLQKTGQLFALRHSINLDSDLLDTPDFYWDREDLENLYQIAANYFCINKRTKIMNEKINHCIELVQLLSSHLNDKHHIRLEWMIIILIMVEVVFEIIHFADK